VQDVRWWLPLSEVVAPLPSETNVCGEESRPDAVVDGLSGADEVEQVVGGNVGHDQRQHGRREDSPGATQVEARQGDRAPLRELRQQDSGDQEAGEDE